MNISSKIKKIVSFVVICSIVVNFMVLPTSAAFAGEWEDNEYHAIYEDFSDAPKYSKEDLVYTGELSINNAVDFNLKKQYGFDWVKDSGCYLSQPFNYYLNWTKRDPFLTFSDEKNPKQKAIQDMLKKDTFDSISSLSFVTNNNINMDNYDVYYTFRQGYHPTKEVGYLFLDYWFVPKGNRIAFVNENAPEGATDLTELCYGLYLDPRAKNYESYWHVCYRFNPQDGGTDNKYVRAYLSEFAKSEYYQFAGWAHQNTISTNIPIFQKKSTAVIYLNTGGYSEDPSNKIQENNENVTNKISANSFGWDSFKCRLSQSGKAYNFIYNYTYSSSEMKKDPSSFFMDIEYSQVIRYRNKVNTGAYEDKTATKKSCMLVSSTGTSTDSLSVIDTKGSFGQQFVYAVCLLVDEASSFFGSGTDLTNIDIYSSNIYVTVKLRHKRILSDNPILDGVDKVLSDISSDVRTFKFNALDLSSLDNPEEISSDVITKDAVDSGGNVITDSNGNPVKEVSQIITNDNSTHTTINNYYYDSNGRKTDSSGSSVGDSLSDIASGLINFIKTLVTEGLPAALEILKTLIKSVTDLLGFVADQIGDIGTGTSNGLIAVLKAIPTPLWGICSVGLIVFVIAGVLKKIF